MRAASVWAAAAALLALAAARRSDQDFEFDDDSEAAENAVAAGADRRPLGNYVLDAHKALCGSVRCAEREVCVVRAGAALCAAPNDILRSGDVIVSTAYEQIERGGEGAAVRGEEDDVFYEAGRRPRPPDRCVGCGSGGTGFLCGSDNRTYSSLCRLDLHNCVRRPAPPVTMRCRGFCPCGHKRPRSRPRAHQQRRRRPDPALAAPGAKGCALDEMANRLLDWFSVLMEEAGAAPPPRAGFPGGCKGEVRWMFAHLDEDGDGLLSAAELYALRHDERERCLRPFLASCGGGGGGDGGGGVSRGSWCGCLRGAARGCAALARAASTRGGGGGWAPACDARGYYRPRQCHAALAVCWCVDTHGLELPGTRTKGEPPCPSHGGRPGASGAPGGGGAPADDEDEEGGSGDVELRE